MPSRCAASAAPIQSVTGVPSVRANLAQGSELAGSTLILINIDSTARQ
jgi:hypothetical protein